MHEKHILASKMQLEKQKPASQAGFWFFEKFSKIVCGWSNIVNEMLWDPKDTPRPILHHFGKFQVNLKKSRLIEAVIGTTNGWLKLNAHLTPSLLLLLLLLGAASGHHAPNGPSFASCCISPMLARTAPTWQAPQNHAAKVNFVLELEKSPKKKEKSVTFEPNHQRYRYRIK